ncbi:vascular endothelial growth factor A [Anabrus simplex]|uniref:vascular endothelial growth factor A n=1 Tax=Anabrus simplex TaxID=316456 RepID=UPI0034DCD8D7
MASGYEVICVLLLLVLPDIECMLISRFGGHQFFRRDEPDPEIHQFQAIDGACTDRDAKRMYMEVMKQSTCSRPLEAVVKLVPDDDNYEFLPSHVRVKRCFGSCSAAQACLPRQTKPVKVMVRLLDRVTNTITCGTVEVEEHSSCMCSCAVMEKHCTKLQVYKPKDCMCECLNVEEKDKCLIEGNIWNTNRCSCECDQLQECSTGMVWVPSHCRCMRVMY